MRKTSFRVKTCFRRISRYFRSRISQSVFRVSIELIQVLSIVGSNMILAITQNEKMIKIFSQAVN